jgi:hypothetical protein
MPALQREQSSAGMNWSGSERRLTESSSHTNRLPNAGSSAMAVIEGMKLERQLRFALPPFVHFQQEKLVDESEWLLWSK